MAAQLTKPTMIIIFLLTAALFACTEGSAISKQKILGLIKKLEKSVVAMYGGTFSGEGNVETSENIENEVTTARDEVMATTPPTKKAKVVKARDPNKRYCDAMECPVPTCTDKEIIYYGNLRKKTPYPTIHELCNSRIIISAFMKNIAEIPNSCCAYNMTQISINNDKILGCAHQVHDANKKTNPTNSMNKYWTSGKWSAACKDYVWCPDKEIIAGAKWKKGFPKPDQGNCVGINLGSLEPDENGLFNGKCSDMKSFYCIETDVV